MPDLSWNEIRDRAIRFSRDWAGTFSEISEKQTFWNEFFEVFGLRRRSVASFEEPVQRIPRHYGRIDLFWPGKLLVEHKSFGEDLGAATSQAFSYIRDLTGEGRLDEIPRYVIVSDFANIVLYDLEPEDQRDLPLFDRFRYLPLDFPLGELHRHVRSFAFLRGERTLRIDPQDPANQKAYDRMCQLHEELSEAGFTGADLERLLVRILFCLFAEDNSIFDPGVFTAFIREQTRSDGSDLGAKLNELFDWLNNPRADETLPEGDPFTGFCYVNGRLFEDRLGFPRCNSYIRERLLECCNFQWGRISPAVFGSLFQGILESRERRQQGAHYTSEENIMKLLRSLFLDDLRAELQAAVADGSSRRVQRLEEFRGKLRTLRFFDPACGCGNFLVLAYREIRILELEALHAIQPGQVQRAFNVRDILRVDVDQFHGVEYGEWPVRIAEVAMWLMDHQMNQKASELFGQYFKRLPLRSSPHIVQGNALRIDWREFLPPSDEVFVLGNPPFVGKQFRTSEQQEDMNRVWGSVAGAGVLDYVTCWYRKAAEYINGTNIKVSFVSTNSITQGEQVGILWGELFGRWHLKIHFAHRTFGWASESRGKAHVHVVIVGFGRNNSENKRIYEYDANDQVTVSGATNISPYLVAGNDLVVRKRSRPLCGQPEIAFGSMPNDGGYLLLDNEERDRLLQEHPGVSGWIRRFIGSEEFINGVARWCLWLVDADPSELRNYPAVMHRVQKVREHRNESRRSTTRDLATTPTLFGEIRQPSQEYLLIPGVSSEQRTYIPMAFMPPEVIASNLVYSMPGATLLHFGILSSGMHMAWVRAVCGRLESRYRYSNKLVYNNFPWPIDVEPQRQRTVEVAAQAVLDVRDRFLPPAGTDTLADLYDPLTMPPDLVAAHTALDRAVDRCYRAEAFHSDRERVEYLFALYERLTAPLMPPSRQPRRRRSVAT